MNKPRALILGGWALAIAAFWFLIVHGLLSNNTTILFLTLLAISGLQVFKKTQVQTFDRKSIYGMALIYVFILLLVFPLPTRPVYDPVMAVLLAGLLVGILWDGVKISRRIQEKVKTDAPASADSSQSRR